MIPPINLLFSFLQQQTPVQIWLYEQVNSRLEGKIRVCIMSDCCDGDANKGFDEFMNLVIDDAVEVNTKKNTKRTLGRILLKGDNITLISSLES